jgi:hypothetical protein
VLLPQGGQGLDDGIDIHAVGIRAVGR